MKYLYSGAVVIQLELSSTVSKHKILTALAVYILILLIKATHTSSRQLISFLTGHGQSFWSLNGPALLMFYRLRFQYVQELFQDFCLNT